MDGTKAETMKKVAALGGLWDGGAGAGAFCWRLVGAASSRNRNISRQLVNARFSRGKFPGCFNDKSVFLKDRATWQNRQPPKGGS